MKTEQSSSKPKREPDSDSEDYSDTGSMGSPKKSDDEELNETVDVDFEFCEPVEIHFHGIKTLLRQTFSTDFEMVDLSALSDFIIKQSKVGSVVKVDDSDDPYALTTCISMHSVFLY
jgi:protein BCP1